jgi:protein tyrosine phosphatase (PTP) superfamily phosphohydrolase (DUF442 family)
MRPGEVTEKLSISAQPGIDDFAELKRLGFATVSTIARMARRPASPELRPKRWRPALQASLMFTFP